MVCKRLADFECPASHLRDGLARHRQALTLVSTPIRENYPAAAATVLVISDPALVLNEFGSTLCRLGWVSDNLHLVNEGMDKFAAAEHVPDFSIYREPYASFLANYGQGYFIRGEITSNVSDVDSALVRYQQSIWFQDAQRGAGSITTRQAVVAAHLLAASLRQGKERDKHLDEARTTLSSLRPEIDEARPLTRVEQGILEARLLEQEAEGAAGSSGNGNSAELSAEALVDQASRALMSADEALEQVPYPTPTARVLYEKARLAVFRAELAPSETTKAAAEQAIEAARRAIGVRDYAAHHRRLRELSARLLG